MEKNVKKLIVAAAVMGSLVPAGICAARESDEGLTEEAAAQEELTPAQRRERLSLRERKQLDSELIWQCRDEQWWNVGDLLWKGADPNALWHENRSVSRFANEITAREFVFAGADYSYMPSNWRLWDQVNEAIAERERAFDELRILKEVLRNQMAENPQVSVEELARLSVDGQVPYNRYDAYKILNELVADAYKILSELVVHEWKKIKEELALEQEASHVLLDGQLLPVSGIVDLVRSYTHLQKAAASDASEEKEDAEQEEVNNPARAIVSEEAGVTAQGALSLDSDSDEKEDETFYESALRDADRRRRDVTGEVPQPDKDGFYDQID